MNPGRKRIPGLDDPARRQHQRSVWRSAVEIIRSPSHWLFAGIISTLGWALLNSGAAIENIRTTPQKTRLAVQEFKAWFYDDYYWTGVWGNNTEYMLGAPDLSEVDVRLALTSEAGIVGGMISTPWTCMRDRTSGLANVEGEIDVWGRLRGSAWDFVDNKKVIFFTFTADKDDLEQRTIRVRQGALAPALPANALLIKQLAVNEDAPVDAFDTPPRCLEERAKFSRHMKEGAGRVDVNELSSSSSHQEN